MQVRLWAYFAGGAAIAVACAVACLPDLAVAPMTPPPLTHPCGDGFTDLDAGEQCDPGTYVMGADGGDAGAVGCTGACTIACEGYVGANGHCYFRAADGPFANAACGPGAHLVTIVSNEELSSPALTSVAGSDPFWVGLRSDDTMTNYKSVNDEPGWSATCLGCFAIPASDAGFLAATPSGPCVVGSTDLLVPWAQAPCDTQHHVVCEREPAGSLSDPCADFSGTGGCITLRGTKDSGKRYLFVSEAATASRADEQCRKLIPYGSLVVFESREEREQLMRELAAMTTPLPQPRFWIGLARGIDAGIEWTWDDGQPEAAYPPPWAHLEPKSGVGTARAFADRTLGGYDTQLAHVEDLTVQTAPLHPYVCQYR